MKLLFIGDIVGRPGRDIVNERVAALRLEHKIDFVIANGENAAAGAGITGTIAKSLLGAGVDAITLGDHIWDQRGWETEIAQMEGVCRPANLPASNLGEDHLIIEARGFRVAVFTVLGRAELEHDPRCTELRALNAQMLALFRKQDWNGALALIERCRKAADGLDVSGLYDMYVERIASYRADPPPANWDGVYEAETK